jgi:transposase
VNENFNTTTALQKMFDKAGIPLLTLPVHHPELSPIELYWGFTWKKRKGGSVVRTAEYVLKQRFCYLERLRDLMALCPCPCPCPSPHSLPPPSTPFFHPQALVNENFDTTTALQKMFDKAGIPLLTLPVHHPELSPIELYWGYAKNKVAATYHNGRKFKEVKKLIHEYLDEGAERCAKKWYWKCINAGTVFWTHDQRMAKGSAE